MPEGSWAGTWQGPVALGEQLQHLPGTLAPLQQGVARAGTRLVQLPHQGFSLLHGQLPCPAPQALQVGQQGGEVLVGDLCRRDEGQSVSSQAGGRWAEMPEVWALGSGPWCCPQCPHLETQGLGGGCKGRVLEVHLLGASPAQVLF